FFQSGRRSLRKRWSVLESPVVCRSALQLSHGSIAGRCMPRGFVGDGSSLEAFSDCVVKGGGSLAPASISCCVALMQSSRGGTLAACRCDFRKESLSLGVT